MKYIKRIVTNMDGLLVCDAREEVLGSAEAYLNTPSKKKASVGVTCPTCTQTVAAHPRRLYGTMAAALIRLYRLVGGRVGEYAHVNDLKMNRGGDFAKLSLFGLVKPKNKRSKQENAQGLYCLTIFGRLFVLGQVTVPAIIYVFNSEVIERSRDKRIGVKDALGQNFDYHELLNGPT